MTVLPNKFVLDCLTETIESDCCKDVSGDDIIAEYFVVL